MILIILSILSLLVSVSTLVAVYRLRRLVLNIERARALASAGRRAPAGQGRVQSHV